MKTYYWLLFGISSILTNSNPTTFLQVVVWTNEGRNESVPCQKKIPKRQMKEGKKQQKFEKEEDFVNWIEADGDDDEEGGMGTST